MFEGLKKFEISYLAKTEADKEVVLGILREIGASGIVEGKFSEIKLAYPIKKQTSAFFGSAVFEAEPASIDKIDKSLKFKEGILRFLIISALSRRNYLRPAGNRKIEKEGSYINAIQNKIDKNTDILVETAQSETAQSETAQEETVQEETELVNKTENEEEDKGEHRIQEELSDADLDVKLDEILNNAKI